MVALEKERKGKNKRRRGKRPIGASIADEGRCNPCCARRKKELSAQHVLVYLYEILSTTKHAHIEFSVSRRPRRSP